jgi:hypothetical protein
MESSIKIVWVRMRSLGSGQDLEEVFLETNRRALLVSGMVVDPAPKSESVRV